MTKKKPTTTIISLNKDECKYLRVLMAWMLEHLSPDEEYAGYRNVCKKVIDTIDAGGSSSISEELMMNAYSLMSFLDQGE